MKRSLAALFLILISFFNVKASHIVGGELELLHVRGYNYQILFRMYVDEIHQQPGVIDSETQAIVLIFEKGTNEKMEEIILGRPRRGDVQYGEACSVNEDIKKKIQTGVLIFTGGIFLDPKKYINPAGYYMSVEKCCRNGVIANIIDPNETGMTFYTEFPPVIKNGVRFTNSSPDFPQIIGDFPCVGKDFFFDMSGTDVNGDLLVYTMSTPLNAHVSISGVLLLVSPGPAPYNDVVWKTGYSREDQIHGSPSLSIDNQTGLLKLRATQKGLYVFGIKVEEYRNGIKIGEVRRDFQIPVIECEENAPPSISLTPKKDNPDYDPSSDTLQISVEQDTCFTVRIADGNTANPDLYPDQGIDTVSVTIVSNNIPPEIFSIAPEVVVSPLADTAMVNFCLSACNKLDIDKDTTFTISIAITDAPKCPASLAFYDTLNVVIRYKPQINKKPEIGIVQGTGPFPLIMGNSLTIDIYGTDKDHNDLITLTGEGIGFDLSQELSMSFENNVTGQDSISSQFRWVPQCNNLDPGTYKIRFVVDDNSCVFDNSDTTEISVTVLDKGSAIKEIGIANLFTPNNDKLNDYFEIPLVDDGNCEYYFKKVVVYNRWGGKVFESTSPGFKWDGGNNPSGIYYVHVDMNKKLYKGWLEMIRE